MIERIARKGSLSRRLLLSVASSMAFAAPMVMGTLSVSAAQAQAVAPPASPAHAPGDIAGDWQATVEFGKPTRTVLKITKTDKGWSAKMFLLLEQGAQPLDTSGVTLNGSTFRYAIPVMGASYEGTMSADGNSIAGTLTGGPNPLPVTMVRATKETAWEIPPPPPPPKLMAADADPSFEVATIKPNNSGASGLQQLTLNGRNFTVKNASLGDLIAFAYNVQIKQIVGGPDWMDKDRYDIAAVPEQEGIPNPQQLRVMIQKLLTDRYSLKFHHDKRELSAYVLTVGKNPQKLKPTELSGPLPGIGFRPTPAGLTLNVRNGTLADFTGFLQAIVLDRPVVDQTAITGKFDFQFTFTPDDSEFSGHPPPLPTHTDATEPSPGLFEAIQQQLGLKLDAVKTAVDVIAIDHVEKVSAN
jgi:uncharacterized protein (TIGR03435 family)